MQQIQRVGVIEIDLPDGARVRVDSGVNEKALRRVLSALRGPSEKISQVVL
jgi:transposase